MLLLLFTPYPTASTGGRAPKGPQSLVVTRSKRPVTEIEDEWLLGLISDDEYVRGSQ